MSDSLTDETCHVIFFLLQINRFCKSPAIMGASALPIIIFSAIFGVVGIVLPIIAPKGPNRGIVQCVLILTAATCWLFWLCCYMAQMNPLIGPKLHQNTILIMAREWGNPLPDMEGFVPEHHDEAAH